MADEDTKFRQFRIIEVREIIKGEEYLVITEPKSMLVFRIEGERFSLYQAYPDRGEKGYSTAPAPFKHWGGNHRERPRRGKVIKIYEEAQKKQDWGEPWEYNDGLSDAIRDRNKETLVKLYPECTIWDDDMAERAIACVNVCQGIPTDRLKDAIPINWALRAEHHDVEREAMLVVVEHARYLADVEIPSSMEWWANFRASIAALDALPKDREAFQMNIYHRIRNWIAELLGYRQGKIIFKDGVPLGIRDGFRVRRYGTVPEIIDARLTDDDAEGSVRPMGGTYDNYDALTKACMGTDDSARVNAELAKAAIKVDHLINEAVEAEVKRRSSLVYRIKCYLPWCKEFFLSK